MRTQLLLALTLSVFTVSAFGQIDDVVNKKKAARAKTAPSFSSTIFASLFNRIQSIEIASLVDDMKKDGVQERKFGGVISADGRIVDADVWQDGDASNLTEILPFVVKLTSDKKVYVSVAAIDFKNMGAALISDVNVFDKFQFAVFRFDEGVYMRDVKTVGIDFVDIEAKLAPVASSPTQYLAIVAGVNIGMRKETIILDDGQEIQMTGRWDRDTTPQLAFHWNFKAGLELQDQLGIGTVKLRAVADFRNSSSQNRTTGDLTNHNQLTISPTLSVTRPIGGKKSLTFSAGMNINAYNKLNIRVKNSPSDSMSNGPAIDLGQRSRQPFNASLKINF